MPDDKKKKKKRKATSAEKDYFKAGKRMIKGKKVKDPKMEARISAGYGPSGDTSKIKTTSKASGGGTKEVKMSKNPTTGSPGKHTDTRIRQQSQSVTGSGYSPSAQKQLDKQKEGKQSFLNETRQGQRIQKMERRAQAKGKSTGSPMFTAPDTDKVGMSNKSIDRTKKRKHFGR